MKEVKNPSAKVLDELFALELSKADPSASILSFSGVSGAMFQGYSGDIVDIKWKETDTNAPNIRKLTQDQIVTVVGGAEDGTDLKVTIALKGAQPWARTVIFKDGKQITLGLLAQGKEKTVFTFHGPNGEEIIPYPSIKPSELLARLKGKKLTCTSFFRDDNVQNNIIRRNADGTIQANNPANCYTFDIV